MGIGKEKASRRSLRLAACAAHLLSSFALTSVAGPAFAQSLDSDTRAVTNPFDSNVDPGINPINGPQTTVNGNAVNNGDANSPATGDTATAPAISDPGERQNGRIRIDQTTTGSLLNNDITRLNLRDPGVDNLRNRQYPDRGEAPGIAIGDFILKPTVNQSINVETNRTGSVKDNRTFLETDLRSTLTSDWARHALTITGEGVLQRNISGTGEEKPTANVNADLRLDLPSDTVAHITAGYNFYREDTDDPNAIAGARKQSAVNQFQGGLSVERDFGLLRGSSAITLTRTIYSDATLSNGTVVSLSDRDQTAGTWKGRIGYEVSPALIPFIEADLGRTIYDDKRDSFGYERSNRSYGGKAGVQVDLGDKLKGEIGLGYQHTEFDDVRLGEINSPTVDGNIAWSPQRGTDVGLSFSTSVQPSVTPGEAGYVAYQLQGTVAHQLRDNLTAKLTGGPTWRVYPSGSSGRDEIAYDAALGFDWDINRYLDLTTNVGYELTSRKTGDDTQQLRAGIGLTVKR